MNEEIRKLLDERIKAEIESLDYLKSGSEEKTAAVEDLAKLYRLKIEEEKTVYEAENNKKLQKESVKDRYFRLGIAAAEIVLPLIFYGVWMNKGFKFEETGTFTSTTFKGLFNKFRPKK